MNLEGVKFLGQLIIQHKLKLSTQINEQLDERYKEFLNGSNLIGTQIVQWRAEIIELIGKALVSVQTEAVWNEITKWSKLISEGAVEHGVAIDELLVAIRLYRKVIWDLIEANFNEEKISRESILTATRIIGPILDHIAHVFSVAFAEYHKNTIRLAQESLLEVSTPVVLLSDKTAVLPLVGDLDTHRAKVLIENSLKKCIELGNSELIIDLSGVPIVDTMVAHELFQVAKALQLIGVTPTFTGLRPEIVQAAVGLGLDFNGIRTLGSLKQALEK
ncbi:STAS domain-containing protein [Priestia megaterium]|nr:STAS domain-containing protein [Priestia megaterium]